MTTEVSKKPIGTKREKKNERSGRTIMAIAVALE
jgi:hypothetical protein